MKFKALLLLVPLMSAAAETSPPPNVIVILVDDQGYADAGCYGADPKHFTTPHMDRFASEGLRFSDGHAASSVCTPSRYSLLTGQYAFRNPLASGILPGDAPLSIKPGSFTLPALFKS
jgi:arylsulfatase A-like enzyme